MREELEALAARVSTFHITDKTMLRAQREIESALAAGDPSTESRAQYLRAVERYFGGFEREARAHLRDVDKRLENLNQVIFNLTAERGVAVKRIEATQGVLASLRALEEEASR